MERHNKDFKNRRFNHSDRPRRSKFDDYQDKKRNHEFKRDYNREAKSVEVVDERVYYLDDADLIFDEGKTVRLTCSDLSYDARGVCKVNGKTAHNMELVNYPIFVEGILPLEKADVRITSLKKSYGEGVVTSFKHYNYDIRIKPICPNYENCGGCDLMHLEYGEQLKFKTNQVKQTLKNIGQIDYDVDDIIPSTNPFYYRNKVQVPYHYNNKTICGFYKKNSHIVVNMDDCFIQTKLSCDIVKYIKNVCNELKIYGYIEKTHSGILRHVLIRESSDQKQVMVVLVTMMKNVNGLNILVDKLAKRYPNIVSIVQNINKDKTNKILGNENIVLFGQDYIIDNLLGVDFKIGPMSFYQVNSTQTSVLYQTAIEKADLNQDDILIDAYCGIGTIGLIASKYVKEVYGVEIIDEAIQNAKENAVMNGITNCHFVCGKAEEIIKEYQKTIKPTAIIVDPPRKGCDEVFIQTLIEMKIPKMVYVSCNPATLARDLKMLQEIYDIKSITPVDMFPQSNHVETVVCLVKK